jgi:hypothetical protein
MTRMLGKTSMKSNVLSLVLLGATICAASHAQQPAAPAPSETSSTATQSASTSSSSAASTTAPASTSSNAAVVTNPAAAGEKPSGPSPDMLKKAKMNGYYTRVRKGETFFCKKEAKLGTRFETENCMNENQLAMTLERNQAQRDQMMTTTCAGGASCGGGK